MNLKKCLAIAGIGIGSLSFSACDALQQIAVENSGARPGQNGSAAGTLSNAEATSGIKEALKQGLDHSIQTLSARDGFLGNAAVKILMPPEAQKVESTLRNIGLGAVVDDFVTNLNRAAETAVKEAAPVFINSLSQLTVTDAFNILLSGQQDAATSFFRRTTSEQLFSRFSPVVEQAMGQHQVARYWSQLTTAYNRLPLGNEPIETDLTRYVTDKAIEGLFYQVAQEEMKIRNNLAGSRSTPLLQKVFDYADRN